MSSRNVEEKTNPPASFVLKHPRAHRGSVRWWSATLKYLSFILMLEQHGRMTSCSEFDLSAGMLKGFVILFVWFFLCHGRTFFKDSAPDLCSCGFSSTNLEFTALTMTVRLSGVQWCVKKTFTVMYPGHRKQAGSIKCDCFVFVDVSNDCCRVYEWVRNTLSGCVHTGNPGPTLQRCTRHSGGKNPLWTFEWCNGGA